MQLEEGKSALLEDIQQWYQESLARQFIAALE